MKIAILSQAPRCYSTRRLVEAARLRGHSVSVLNPTRFTILLEEGRPRLLYQSQPMEQFDAVVPRIGATITFWGSAVVRQFEHMGVFCLNCAQAIADARDKLRSMQLLSRHHIAVPGTAVVRSNKDILPAIESVGGAPVVLKLIQGTQGVGVILAENNKAAEATIQTLRSARQNVLIQRFVSESRGRDVRAFVVGDRVVAAMRRIAQGEEFRSNVHRGGRAEPITLDQQCAATALRAAHVVGLHVAGVDMLESHEGPKVAEVNCSPGLQGIESATGLDIAGAIVDYLQAQTDYSDEAVEASPEGYDLVEIIASDENGLAGQTIGGPMIEGRGLTVLRLAHNGAVVERPDRHTRLQAGDRLLCFGRARELQLIANPGAAEHHDSAPPPPATPQVRREAM